MRWKPNVIVSGLAIALAGCGVNAGVGGHGAHAGWWLGQNSTTSQKFAEEVIIRHPPEAVIVPQVVVPTDRREDHAIQRDIHQDKKILREDRREERLEDR